MNKILSCEFNMDTACVDLHFADGTMLAIDTIAVENEVADNMLQRSELDYLNLQQAPGIRRSCAERRSGGVCQRPV